MGVRQRRKRNPLLAVLNRPERGTLIGEGALTSDYRRHAVQGQGPWVHTYRKKDVEIRGLKDGRIVYASRSGARLWDRDGPWISNPGKKAMSKRKRRKRSRARRAVARRKNRTRRKPPRGFSSWKAYMKSIRPNRGTARGGSVARKRRRHRHRPRGRHRRRFMPVLAHAGRRRARRHRGGFRRNPGLKGIGATIFDVAKGGAWVTGGKLVSRLVPTFVGVTPVGILGLGVQTLAGGLAGWAVGRFVSREGARIFLYGVAHNAIEGLIRGANLPFLTPGLSDETELYAMAGYTEDGVAGYVERPEAASGMSGTEAPLMVMA